MKRLRSFRPLLLVIIIIALACGGWYFAGQSLGDTYPQFYMDWKGKVQSAVDAHIEEHDGAPPIIGPEAVIVVDGEAQNIIDICALVNARLIAYIPDNCIDLPGDNNDNCDGGDCSCYSMASYIWTVDSNLDVRSACVIESCDANNADGYQGVWP